MALTLVQKKELARFLFLRSKATQSEIAEKVGVSEVTLSKWKKKGNWEDFRKSLLITRPEQLARLYDQLAALNDEIEKRDDGKKYATPKEADTMSKITASIKNLEREISASVTIDVLINFNNWLRQNDLPKAKELIELQDAYVKTLI